MSLLVSQISTRQWATITWVLILVSFLGGRKDFWASVGSVLKSFVTPKLLIPYLALFTTEVGIISVLSRPILWDSDQLLSTLIFISASSFIGLGVAFQEGFNRKSLSVLLLSQVSVGFLLATYTNLYSMHFLLEMVVQPVTLLLVLTPLAQKQMGVTDQGGKIANGLLGALSLGIFLFVGSKIVHSFNTHELARIVREFMTPVEVTAIAVPMIWLLSFYSMIDTINMEIKVSSPVERIKFLFWLIQSKQIKVLSHSPISPFELGKLHQKFVGL